MKSSEIKQSSKPDNVLAKKNRGCLICMACFFVLIVFLGIMLKSTGLWLIGSAGILWMILALLGNTIKTPQNENKDLNKETEVTTGEIQPEKEENNLEFSNNNIFQQDIDRGYFDSIHKYTQEYIKFKNKISANLAFQKQLTSSFRVEGNNNAMVEPEVKVLLLLSADLYTVYLGLGYDFDLDRKESFGLKYLIGYMMGLENKTYETIPLIYDQMCEQVASYLVWVDNFIEDNKNSGYLFLMAPILGNVDQEWEQRYYILLYRFASIIAKADGMMDEKKSDFLENIMQLGKSILQNNEGEEKTVLEK